MKSGDILGGIASSTNTVTGVVQGLSSNITKKDGSKATLKDIKDGDFKVNNNYYANAGVNLGFNKSSSESKSHNEFGVVTTIKGKDKNSSITYNNVKNIEYVGTQAQNTKFIYNNVENITKKAVELNNYSSSSSRSSGISAGVTIGYGDGTQTSVDAVKFSASQSNMNTNGTNFQNGRFVNVDEVHNNTKNMTLSGFNQEGGTVTGNIQNLTIESKQNTSNTTGSTKGGSLSIAPNGMPSGSINYSQTNGERKYVDNATTFLIGDGSNLKISKVDNTAAAIGATGNGKLSIDEYVGHNLENVDKSKTVGGSVGISTSGINSIGINYNDRKQEGITKNTVIGNVEIGKSSGDEINKDLASMTEVTKDRKFETNVNIESQTIKYALNPEAFKQDLAKAKDEITDIGNVVENTINPKGEDSRNIFANLRAQRWNTSFYNVTGSRMEELSRQFKAGEINANQLKEAARDLIKGYGKDIGIDFDVVYLDEETMPKDSKGSTGSSYILDKKNKKVLIPIDVNKIEDINKLLGTLTEEVSHGKDALEGRQDKKVAEDKSNDEEGLESLGRPANDYVKNRLGEDNNSKIKLSTDGIDLTNANVGEKVGDHLPMNDIKAAGGVEKVLRTETEEEIVKRVGNKSLQKFLDEFYQGATNEKLWSGIYDFTPGLGEGKGFIEGLTGKDMITGEKLNMFQRIIGGMPLIHQAGKGLTLINKPIKSGADFIVSYFISDASKGISKLDNINDTTKLANVAEGVGDSSDITKSVVKEIKIADDSADIAKASKNVEKVGDTTLDLAKSSVNNQQRAPIFKSNKEFIYGDYKKSYTIIRPMKGKIESIKELLTIEGQAKAQNMTMQEIYDLAKKEGLNVGKLDDAGISGVGQKFDIVGNGKEKIEIKINGKKIKERKDFTRYELKTVKLENKDIENRILKIVINNEPLNKSQMENLKKVVEHATEDGIKVEAVILK